MYIYIYICIHICTHIHYIHILTILADDGMELVISRQAVLRTPCHRWSTVDFRNFIVLFWAETLAH